ncbi:MAG: hypothetical protein ACP5EP_06820 [Acidobacteriaceae bacterium]
MQKFLLFLNTVFCLVGLTLAFEGTAHAYADPGSGLMALQIIGSTLTGVGLYFRHKIGMFFARRKQTAVTEESGAATKNDSNEA